MKKIGIVLIILLTTIILISLMLTPNSNRQVEKIRKNISYDKYECPPPAFTPGDNEVLLGKAKQMFPDLAGLPTQFEEVFYVALYHYPELAGIQIEVVFKPIGTTLQVQPAPNFLFRKKSARTYRVFINSNPDFEGIQFNDVPFNAKIGLVAHELAHIYDYTHKNVFQILGTGMKFLTKKSQAKYEKSIDLLTIYKGLGWQLRDWAQYAMVDSDATEEYKQFKKENYLQVDEIEKIIKLHPEVCRPEL